MAGDEYCAFVHSPVAHSCTHSPAHALTTSRSLVGVTLNQRMQVVTGTCHHACAHHPHTVIIRSPLACDLLPPFIRHPPPCRRNHSRTHTHAGCLAVAWPAQMCSRAHACSVGHTSCSSAQRGSGSHPEKTNQQVGMRTQNAHFHDERHSCPQQSDSAGSSRHLATPPPACQVHSGSGSDEVEGQRRRQEQPQPCRAVPGPRPSPPLLATSSSSPMVVVLLLLLLSSSV